MKDKKRRRTKREIQKITRTLSAVAVAVVLIAVIAIVLIKVSPIRNNSGDGTVAEENDGNEATAEMTEALQAEDDEENFSLSEEEIARAKERIATVDALEGAWEDTWLKKIDISGDTCDYLRIDECVIMPEDTSKVKVSGVLDGIPDGDSEDLYLFALNTYENSIPK